MSFHCCFFIWEEALIQIYMPMQFQLKKIQELSCVHSVICEGHGSPSTSVGRASDSRSRGPVFETRTVHLVVGSDPLLTSPIRRDARSLDEQDLGN